MFEDNKYLALVFQLGTAKPCACVVFSPHGVLKLPVLRQVKTSNLRSELILQFPAKHYLAPVFQLSTAKL